MSSAEMLPTNFCTFGFFVLVAFFLVGGVVAFSFGGAVIGGVSAAMLTPLRKIAKNAAENSLVNLLMINIPPVD
jgi:hypothetical protein